MEEALLEAFVNVEEKKTLAIARQMLEAGAGKPEILRIFLQGMEDILALFNNGEYYIADVMMADALFKEAASLPERDGPSPRFSGIVVLAATAEGDLHDGGLSIFSRYAEAEGFTVVSLGVSVGGAEILRNVRERRPQVLCLSGTLAQSAGRIEGVLDELEKNNLLGATRVIVGGNAFPDGDAEQRDAVYRAGNMLDAVNTMKQWFAEGSEK